MPRRFPGLPLAGRLALAVLCLASTALAIDPALLESEPSVYSRVVETPDPALVGCFTRVRPSEFKRPNTYAFCLVKKGDKYAVYYDWKDGKTLEWHQGWMPFSIHEGPDRKRHRCQHLFFKDGEIFWHNMAAGVACTGCARD
jgi:hypothetical protein